MPIPIRQGGSVSLQTPQKITHQLSRLWPHIGHRRRSQFGLLLGLMLLASIAEIISIGAVLPFLAVLTVPERIFDHALAQPLIQLAGLTSPAQLLLPLTIGFALAALGAGAMRVALVWVSVRIAYATGADLSVNIYRRTLFQPYAIYVARNSSEVISGITGKVAVVINQVINPALTLITSAIMFVAILGVLLTIEPRVTALAILIIAHRLTTLRNCTQIVELGDGRVRRIGTYQEIVNKAA